MLTEIPDYAFSNCVMLHELNLPESLMSIGEESFALCESLKEITLPSGITAIPAVLFTDAPI